MSDQFLILSDGSAGNSSVADPSAMENAGSDPATHFSPTTSNNRQDAGQLAVSNHYPQIS